MLIEVLVLTLVPAGVPRTVYPQDQPDARVIAEAVTSRAAIDSVRQAEIESGVLEFPNHPTALYSLFADRVAFDPASGEAEGARGLYVIYVPYATEASTGISAVASRERPWLMFPGKPWAHVMIPR